MLAAVEEEVHMVPSSTPTICRNVDRAKLCMSLIAWMLFGVVLVQIVMHIF